MITRVDYKRFSILSPCHCKHHTSSFLIHYSVYTPSIRHQRHIRDTFSLFHCKRDKGTLRYHYRICMWPYFWSFNYLRIALWFLNRNNTNGGFKSEMQ